MKHPVRLLGLSVTVLSVAVTVLALGSVAHAQSIPVPAPNNPNGAELAAWAALGYAVLGPLVSIFRPDNTALPFSVSETARTYIVLAGTALMAFLLAVVNGTPWTQAIVTALVSGLTAYAAHARRVAPGATAGEATAQKSHRPPPMTPPRAGV
jgi:tetrahydromethanopterin S-methyltransferase subunit C